MWEVFSHPSNIVFSISLCLMLFLGILEIFLLLLGGGSQGFFDQFLPDDISQHSAEIHVDGPTGLFNQVLDWLYLGRVPLFVWLIIFLTVYSLFGYAFQSIVHIWTHIYLSAWIAAPISLFLAMPLVRISAKVIAKILPTDETTAIYSEELIGRTATIILGEARQHYPAEAKVQDQHGQMHYILVEPEHDQIFKQGQTVILTQKTKNGFQAIVL